MTENSCECKIFWDTHNSSLRIHDRPLFPQSEFDEIMNDLVENLKKGIHNIMSLDLDDLLFVKETLHYMNTQNLCRYKETNNYCNHQYILNWFTENDLRFEKFEKYPSLDEIMNKLVDYLKKGSNSTSLPFSLNLSGKLIVKTLKYMKSNNMNDYLVILDILNTTPLLQDVVWYTFF